MTSRRSGGMIVRNTRRRQMGEAMRSGTKMIMALALAGGALACASAEGQIPVTQPTTQPARPAMQVRIDTEANTVSFPARVVLREGPLELLVCRSGTKEHESILATPARPSHIHAGLLALGLRPGRAAHWATTPDGQGVFLPPSGATLNVTFRWTDADGQEHAAEAHQWLRRPGEDDAVEPIRWVFVGSEIIEGGHYWADTDGEVICVANFPGPVIDVPFESSNENALLAFAARTEPIPPLGTEVTVVLKPVEGAASAEVARAVFRVDRFGRYFLEGERIEVEQIRQWAREFKARHARPFIVIEAAPRSLTYDVERLRRLMGEARIVDIETRMSAVAGEILPRTGEQMLDAVEDWQQQFDQYRELIRDPGRQADVILRQIEYRREELGDLIELWTAYERELRRRVGEYRATSQPVEWFNQP